MNELFQLAHANKPGMVGSPRESWNSIFFDLQVLCERLERLDIEAFMEIDND